jgi:hypothetical protein
MSILAGEYNLERSRSESFTRFWKNNEKYFTESADKTVSDSLKARILLDEVERSGTYTAYASIVEGKSTSDADFDFENIDSHAWNDEIQEIREKVKLRVKYISESV